MDTDVVGFIHGDGNELVSSTSRVDCNRNEALCHLRTSSIDLVDCVSSGSADSWFADSNGG